MSPTATAAPTMTVNHEPGPVTDPRADVRTDQLARALRAAAVIADPELQLVGGVVLAPATGVLQVLGARGKAIVVADVPVDGPQPESTITVAPQDALDLALLLPEGRKASAASVVLTETGLLVRFSTGEAVLEAHLAAVTGAHASSEAARKVLEITTRFITGGTADWSMRPLVLDELLTKALGGTKTRSATPIVVRHCAQGTVLAIQEWAVLIAMGATDSAPRRGPLSRLLNPGGSSSDREG